MISIRPLIVLLSVVVLAYCHTYLAQISVNGQAKGWDAHIRAGYPGASNGIYRDSPVSDVGLLTRGLLGANLTCGFLPYANNLAKPSSGKAAVKPGDKITLQYYHATYEPSNPPDLNAFDVYIDPSHVGPIMVYMAKHSGSGVPSGNAWFKVFEDGYNSQTKEWAVSKMIANKGKVDFTIPATLAAGDYLMRTEIIALHGGHLLYGAQSYPHCVEISVSGNENGQPNNFVAIPGVYKYDDAGILFSPYNGNNGKYKCPGPAVATLSAPGTGTVPTPVVSTPAAPSTTGQVKTSTPTAPTQPTTPVVTQPTPTPATPTTPTTPSTPASGSDKSSCTTIGNMRCTSEKSATYQTCSPTRTGQAWSEVQNCPAGRTCSPSGQYIYCL